LWYRRVSYLCDTGKLLDATAAGVTPFHTSVHAYLNKIIPGQWIGHVESVAWPLKFSTSGIIDFNF
jgi:hypothetical protein